MSLLTVFMLGFINTDIEPKGWENMGQIQIVTELVLIIKSHKMDIKVHSQNLLTKSTLASAHLGRFAVKKTLKVKEQK